MTNILKGIGLVIVGAVVGAFFWGSFGVDKAVVPPTESTGGVYNQFQKNFAEGISVGPSRYNPSSLTLVKMGTCSLLADASITASTTKGADCVISGVLSTDIVDLTLAASTTLASQYVIKSSHASSTAGYATAELINLTGTTATPSATNGFGSSTVYKIWRTR